MIAAYGVVWPILAVLGRLIYGLSPSVRKGRFALRNGPICRVCAPGKPWARRIDPIIGLSQKGILLTLLLHSLHFRWTSRPQEANCRHGQFGTQANGASTRTQTHPTDGSRALCRIQRSRKSHRARVPWRAVAGALAQERAGSGSVAAGGRQRRV